MAKQFGVSDQALEGLKDPERHPFPPDQKAALLFADAMTEGSAAVPEDLFQEMRRHFTEPQIVEIATVIGVFNYFNRFNNALHTEITLMDPDVLVRRLGEAATAAGDAGNLCERLAGLLKQGRRYGRVEIRRLPPGAGPTEKTDPTSAAGGLFSVPIRSGGTIVGVIEVESDRPDAFGDEDRSIVERRAPPGPMAT